MSDKTVLTEEAIDELRDRFDFDGFVDQKTAKRAFARAIERAVLAASEDRKDAERYRVLRDSKYQMHEDDICVSDASFNTYFDDDLDAEVDKLKRRYDAAIAAGGTHKAGLK